MARRLDKTLADLVVAALMPALLIGLLTSLVFFLLELAYAGQYIATLKHVLVCFIIATVLIARISMMGEISDRAAVYGIALAIAAGLALVRFVDVPQKALGGLGWLIPISMMAMIWWSAHKLTLDCTWDEEADRDDSGGLLDKSPEKAPLPPDRGDHWFDRYQSDRQEEQKRKKPGTMVIYFSLAALPLFGMGQAILPATDLDGRRYAFWLLVIYMLCGLGLLMTTSFLGLRRYLRARKLQMPAAMTGLWLTLGAAIILGLLVLGSIIPRPEAEYSLYHLMGWAGSKERDASKTSFFDHSSGKSDDQGIGPQNPNQKNQGGQRQGNQSRNQNQQGRNGQSGGNQSSNQGRQDQRNQQGGNQGQSNRSGDRQNQNQQGQGGQGQAQGQGQGQSEQDRNNQQSQPVTAGNRQNQPGKRGERGDNSKQGQGGNQKDQQGEEGNQEQREGGKSDQRRDQEKRDQQRGGGSENQKREADQSGTGSQDRQEQQQSSPPPPSPPSPAWDWLNWLVYAAMAIAAIYAIYRWGRQIWNALLQIWRDILAWWRGLLTFENKKTASTEIPDPESELPPQPFAWFSNPLLTPARFRSMEEMIRYSFAALHSWAYEQNLGRDRGETPAEFAQRLGHLRDRHQKEIKKLADLYAYVTYAGAKAPNSSEAILRSFWGGITAPYVHRTA